MCILNILLVPVQFVFLWTKRDQKKECSCCGVVLSLG